MRFNTYISLLYLFIHATIIVVCGEDDFRGLLVIPGLGRLDRLDTVVNNIKILEPYLSSSPGTNKDGRSGWDCVIYVYAPRTFPPHDDNYFWSAKEKLDYLSSKCDIIENPNHKVTENMKMVQPALIKRTYQYIFILLDDCKIMMKKDFKLDEMISIMKENKLTLASPRVMNANTGGGQGFRTIMQALPPQIINKSPGYIVSFVEIFAIIMTIDAYTALWNLLCPIINPYGWGYDFWYDHYAKLSVKGHKMGIISEYSVKHEQIMSDNNHNNGRTDSTKKEDKWQALVLQERYYQHHFGSRLHRFRETLDLRNMSWNGAVIDYLKYPIEK